MLYGVDRSGKGYPLRSPNPKVYLPAGNCLMGLIRDKQSMALAWLGSGGADQMIGYVVSTWYGRGGWGTRDYFFSEPGRYTLSEAFYFNNQSIVYELQSRFPKTANVDFNQWNIETDPRHHGPAGGPTRLYQGRAGSERQLGTALGPRHGGLLRRPGLGGPPGAAAGPLHAEAHPSRATATRSP